MTLQKVPVTKRYLDFQKFLNHIDSLGQVNPDEKNYELIHWLEKLPAMIDKIQSSTIIHDIWFKYASLVEENVDYYSLLCSQCFLKIKTYLEEFFSNWNGLSSFREFIKGCLNACHMRKDVKR